MSTFASAWKQLRTQLMLALLEIVVGDPGSFLKASERL